MLNKNDRESALRQTCPEFIEGLRVTECRSKVLEVGSWKSTLQTSDLGHKTSGIKHRTTNNH